MTKLPPYIEQVLKRQRVKSEKARLAYEKSRDPQVVIKYIQGDVTGETLKEAWITTVLADWKLHGHNDLISKAFNLNPRGAPVASYEETLANLLFVDQIERRKKEEGTLKAAYIAEAQSNGKGELIGHELDQECARIKSKYNRLKKIPITCWVTETDEYVEIKICNCKVTGEELPVMRGTAIIKLPK